MDPFALPPELEKFAGAALPAPSKMMTAKGLAPLKPKEMITSVYFMSLDTDQTIRETALKTLGTLPEGILKAGIDGGLAPQVLDGMARQVKIEPTLEAIALSPKVHDETLCFLAEHGSSRVIDIIANNQTRLLHCPAILDALGKNPLTGQSVIDRVLSFLTMEGVLSKKEEASDKELSVDEFIATLDNFEVPQDFEIPQELIDDMQDMPEDEVKGLYGKILRMTVMQKIKLALKGNKEARSLLIRDSNKLVSSAVVKSPKITDNEIVAITFSRTVGDNVMRIIAKNKDWTKVYRIKLGLASNPKTPFDIALRMLKMLRDNDLAALAKSKAVPNAVSMNAKRMISVKEK